MDEVAVYKAATGNSLGGVLLWDVGMRGAAAVGLGRCRETD
jgi:hypothetical protein